MEERGAAAARQAFGFGAVCLAFLAGAALGAVVTPLLGNAALWVADLLLGAGMVLFLIELQPPEPTAHGPGQNRAARVASGASRRP